MSPEGPTRCMDCGGDYDALMAMSLDLRRAQWLMIHPDDGGVLCANCIVRRAERLPGAIAVIARIAFADDYEDLYRRAGHDL